MTFGRNFTEWRERREAEKAANLRALAIPPRTLHRGVYGGTTTGPAPKTEAYRDPVLLEMARGRVCTLADPVICDHSQQPADTVAAHANWSWAGKGMGRKADDVHVAYLCHCAHSWLDQGKARAEDKEMRFLLAHANTVLLWRLIAQDSSEPERFRAAARRALERLGATPIAEEPWKE